MKASWVDRAFWLFGGLSMGRGYYYIFYQNYSAAAAMFGAGACLFLLAQKGPD